MDDQHQPPKPPGYPESPNQGPRLRPNERDVRDLKVAQNLVMVASIAGPVSLFIGGVFLATAGLVCAIIAFKKLNALSTRLTDVAVAAKRLKRSCIIGIVVCSIALVLNAVSAYLMYPAVLEALESGDYGNLAPSADLGTAPKGNSTWG